MAQSVAASRAQKAIYYLSGSSKENKTTTPRHPNYEMAFTHYVENFFSERHYFFLGKKDSESRGFNSLKEMSANAGSTALVGNGATLRGFALDTLAAAFAAASREAAVDTSSPCRAANALERGEAALTTAVAAERSE